MVKKVKVGDLVYVEWVDNCTFDRNNWRDRGVFEDVVIMTIQSVGWVVRTDDECLAIAAHSQDWLDLALVSVQFSRSARNSAWQRTWGGRHPLQCGDSSGFRPVDTGTLDNFALYP